MYRVSVYPPPSTSEKICIRLPDFNKFFTPQSILRVVVRYTDVLTLLLLQLLLLLSGHVS